MNMIALTFPARTTNLFQVLDLVSFDNFQHLKATAAREFGDDSVNSHVTQLIQGDDQTATSSIIRGPFRRAEMTAGTATRPWEIMVDQAIMRESPGFHAAWERNMSVEDL
jgi:hypothetical protein